MLMNTIIVDINALRAIRRERRIYSRLTWEPLSQAEARHVLNACAPNKLQLDFGDFDRHGFMDESEPELLHVLVGSPNSRRPSSCPGIVQHVYSGKLPNGAIMRVDHGIYAMSPAHIALQYSITHSLEETFMLVMELLGTYTLPEEATFPIARGETWSPDPDASEDDAQKAQPDKPEVPEVNQARYRCDPAVSIGELRALARWAKSSRYDTFRRAVALAAPGSASPMETIQYGVFGFPMGIGGFACRSLPKGGVLLNHRIDFDHDACVMASGIPYAVCDAFIPAANFVLEYNGADHEDAASALHDAKRNNGLKGMGITVLVITRAQMSDIEALEAIARVIYRSAGQRFRYRITGYRIRQQNLLNALRKGVGLRAV